MDEQQKQEKKKLLSKNYEDKAAMMLSKILPNLEVHTEYRFHDIRMFRFDVAVPEHKVAMEIHGGIFNMGGHNRAKGIKSDADKQRHAAMGGWTVFPCVPSEIYATVQMVADHIQHGTAEVTGKPTKYGRSYLGGELVEKDD